MMMMMNNSKVIHNNHEKEVLAEEVVDHHDQDDVPLPGFRFHPTDQELLGFYLRRKVENRGMSIELIKHVDIYKYDPWDLPCSGSSNVGDKEWYFYCKRGRKYKNSIRPNRVTASGFWKATGIDRPIYNNNTTITTGGEEEGARIVIGLKKSLVFYRGSAGKGTKTDWMMHEFRLPHNNINIINHHDQQQEAEVWTLCRIIKRNNNHTIATYNNNNNKCSMQLLKPCSSSSNMESNNQLLQTAGVPFISFTDPLAKQYDLHAKKKRKKHDHNHNQNHGLMKTTSGTTPTVLVDNMESSSSITTNTTSNYQNLNDYNYNYLYNSSSNIKYGNWDALSPVYLESCLASDHAPVDHHHHPNFLA